MKDSVVITSCLFPNQAFVYEQDEQLENPNKVEKKPKLKKDGTPKNIKSNKKKGRKSEVFNFSTEDASKILRYFSERNEWLHYLLFVLSCNMARRNGDMMALTWEHFFNPVTGNFRKDLREIEEQKTDKIACPHINIAVKDAINLYIEKTGCDPSVNNYKVPICLQLSGNYKGSILTYDGCRKGIKRAAEAVGVEYNVATHSARKTFGAMSRMIHPNDYDSMELLQTIYNHTDSKTTKHYIGLTKQKIDAYYDDMGDFFNDHIIRDNAYQASNTPIVSLDANDLRDIISAAYKAGKDNAENSDVMAHVEAINKIMDMVENLRK